MIARLSEGFGSDVPRELGKHLDAPPLGPRLLSELGPLGRLLLRVRRVVHQVRCVQFRLTPPRLLAHLLRVSVWG